MQPVRGDLGAWRKPHIYFSPQFLKMTKKPLNILDIVVRFAIYTLPANITANILITVDKRFAPLNLVLYIINSWWAVRTIRKKYKVLSQ